MPITIPMHTIARVLSRHGLGRGSVEALPGGQINASYLVDDRYVLRINLRPEEHGKLAREQRVLAMLRGEVPVPETIVYDGSGRLIPHEYVIQSYVPGESLLSRWGQAGAAERASYVRQLAALLRRMHGIRLAGFGDPANPRVGENWAGLHAVRAAHALEAARTAANADPLLLDQAERALTRDATALTAGYPCLTHGDLHFGNIHVQRGQITGLLDFERSWAAAADWELDQLLRFVHYPALFADPGLTVPLDAERFATEIPALRREYPDLFAVAGLGARLRVYALEYELRSLASARRRHNNDQSIVQAITTRLHDTLADNFPALA